LKDCGSKKWREMADATQISSWKESVKNILIYYLERTPGAQIEDRRCSIIFHYKSAEDYESAARQASDCASHINDACEEQRVHAIELDGCIIIEPIDWTKSTAAAKVFEGLSLEMAASEAQPAPVDFLMVVGDGREDEKVFKWANALGDEGAVKEVVTVSLGSRNTEATATLTQGVNGKSRRHFAPVAPRTAALANLCVCRGSPNVTKAGIICVSTNSAASSLFPWLGLFLCRFFT
jgi:trehalose-phosphatase